jgi:predicted esterase
MPSIFARRAIVAATLSLAATYVPCQAADSSGSGFQPEARVAAATRLDWQFACAGFGADAAKLPRDYDSTKQQYQLYVPAKYTKEKAWPLVVFISPGDDPGGWKQWQKICEDNGYFFCAAYRAGNNCPVGQRTRITLDAFDDVRQHYRIDPDQTYLTGFSGGGRMACSIGFALPEYFGGVIPICGTNPIAQHSYLYHRILDRLSVAFVTGENDFNRKENEEYMYPWFTELGIRSKLWVAPKLGHGIPSDKSLSEAVEWIADDLKRRQQDAKDHPQLVVKADEAPTPAELAGKLLEAGEAELKSPEHTWRGVVLLQGVKLRADKSEAATKASKLLEDVQSDEKKLKLIEEQGAPEDRLWLTAQAKALQRMGNQARAIRAWKQVVEKYPDSKEGKQAADEIARLEKELANRAFLGVACEQGNTIVTDVIPKSPAEKAGIKPGDKLVSLDDTKLTTLKEVSEAVAKHKAGDKVSIELERDGKKMMVTVELGMVPQDK